MTTRIAQSREELEAQLAEQVAFIRASAKAFDEGYESEAKRLAVAVRVLVHDKGNSRSLLGQLGLKSIGFFDTAHDWRPGNLLTHMGLVAMRMDAHGGKYVALLDGSPRGQGEPVPFKHWWEKVVFVDDRRAIMTREQLILAMANQDGGAHVDPALNEMYARLSRQNSMGWVTGGPAGERQLDGAHFAAVRQIAHEVLVTVKERAMPSLPPLPLAQKQARNDLCACGSGKKYKKCHGGPAA